MLSGFSFLFISCIMTFIIYLYYFFFMRSKVGNVNSKGDVCSVKEKIVPTSVNYHFTRKCNYQCGFCFHTAKTSDVLPMGDAEKGLTMLRNAGMKKVNFSGGEPFIVDGGDYLGKLVKFCKIKLQLPSVSIVSNGSLIREAWFKKYGEYLDIMAISCDSFIEDTNKMIGRASGKRTEHVKKMARIRDWCREYRVAFKINTVVNTFNVNEDMAENIALLDPVRWKVFQCLLLEGENVGPSALKNAEKFYISDQQFQKFLDLHSHIKCLVPESNVKMQNSYLILDEYMRFLDCREGTKKPSLSILDVGVDNALDQSGFDEAMFRNRGGLYTWSKRDLLLDW